MHFFAGRGVHPPENKFAASSPIETMPVPGEVVVHLSQHVGAPCTPLVKRGDRVYKGQKIGDADAFVTAPVHAPVSGTVKAIKPYLHPTGRQLPAVIIESDGEDALYPDLEGKDDPSSLSVDEIVAAVREAGIVGLGGAAFPSHVKLKPPPNRNVDTLLVNGAECEPFLSGDHRLMVEESLSIAAGVELVMKVLGVGRACVCIENNKPDAIEAMERAVSELALSGVEVVGLETLYPQGAEKTLILNVLGREVPSGGLPFDAGVVVHNVGTVHAIYTAVRYGMPLVERVVTVAGRVNRVANVRARIGARFEDLVEFCGGITAEVHKIVMGGPMMGLPQVSLDVPVVKGTSGILLFSREDSPEREEVPCIRCGRCVEVCPMRLVPCEIADAVYWEKWDMAERFDVMDCVECGCCSFVCPAMRPITHYVRIAKAELVARRKRNGS